MPARAKEAPGPLTQEVAAILRAELGRLGRSQDELARAVDISQSQLSKMLRAERHIDLDQLDRLCHALHLDLARVVHEASRLTEIRLH